jgi:hypothetical protein
MSASLGKNLNSLRAESGKTVPAGGARRVVGENANNSSSQPLPALGRNDLIREWQGIVLQFPLKQAAEEQDATRQAVEKQRNGDSAASLLAAVNQARANPRVRAAVARLIGMPSQWGNPDFMQALDHFMAYYASQQQQAEDGPAAACDEANLDLFGPVRGNA